MSAYTQAERALIARVRELEPDVRRSLFDLVLPAANVQVVQKPVYYTPAQKKKGIGFKCQVDPSCTRVTQTEAASRSHDPKDGKFHYHS